MLTCILFNHTCVSHFLPLFTQLDEAKGCMDVNYLDREVQDLAKRLSIFASSSDFEFTADETADQLSSSLQALTTSVSASVPVPKTANATSTETASVSATSKTTAAAVPVNPFAVPVNPFAVDNNAVPPPPPPRRQAVNDHDDEIEAQKPAPVIPEHAATTAPAQTAFEYNFGNSSSQLQGDAGDDDDEIDLS